MDCLGIVILILIFTFSFAGKNAKKQLQPKQPVRPVNNFSPKQQNYPSYAKPAPAKTAQTKMAQAKGAAVMKSAARESKPEPAYDILKRATENVNQVQQEDDFTAAVQKEHTQSLTQTQVAPVLHNHDIGSIDKPSDRMKKVEDLMITGYSGNLNFQRDFVAEGIDMLNRFEIR